MKIGYLHLGASEHGVCRYGKLLANQGKTQAGIKVFEYDLQLSDNPYENVCLFEIAAKHFVNCGVDVIHLQFTCLSNATLWGKGKEQYNNLKAFFDRTPIPVVVTIHDLFLSPSIWQNIAQQVRNKLFLSSSPKVSNKVDAQVGFFGYGASCLNLLLNRVSLALLFTEDQYQAVKKRYGNGVKKCSVIPHFVETRNIEISKSQARKILNLENHRVITLQGFIYRGKGHELLIKALPELPEDVKIVFAGGTFKGDTDKLLKELMRLMEEYQGCDANGTANTSRIKITGYLSEEELEMYLKATDIAVCPYYRATASGALSTWISVGCPIIASDIPVFKAYNQIQPDAIKFFSPYTPSALAKAINQLLKEQGVEEKPSENLKLLGDKLSISNIFQQHLTHYRQIERS